MTECKHCGRELIEDEDGFYHLETGFFQCERHNEPLAEPKGDCKSPIPQSDTIEGEHE